MKKLLMASVIIVGSLAPQISMATCTNGGALDKLTGLLMIASVTSAPTGTLITSGYLSSCREEILVLQENAKHFAITGEASELLKQAVDSAKRNDPSLTDLEVVEKLINTEI